ncbi:ABC transporter permease [Aggregatilinea lenta]|uniref:ABC transporter permease n=1 Tax=Aggregatilinea lenta TaxID=913108 RepID=UPI001EE8DCA3|nr:ABC transporter permease [Aggregatilinea lenta]
MLLRSSHTPSLSPNLRRALAGVRKVVAGELGLVVMLFLIVILFSTQSEFFLVERNLLNITRQISVNLIVAIGMTFVILTGEIDLSVGSVAALSGIAAGKTMVETGSITLGILTGLAVGLGVGLVNGVLTVYGKIQSFIVTLAMLGIARGAALYWTDGRPISNLPEKFDFFGAGYVGRIPTSTIIAVVILVLGYIILQRTKYGTYILATGANREAARLSAIPVDRYRIIAFLASGLCSAVGGILIASRLLSAQPVAADGLELNVIAAVILGGASLAGGVGTVFGTLLGAMIIGVIDNGMNLTGVSAFLQQIVKGTIILVAVLAKRDNE